MKKFSLRTLSFGFLVAFILISVFASPALASTKASHARFAPLSYSAPLEDCALSSFTGNAIFGTRSTGNASDCLSSPGYLYEPLSQNTSLTGYWTAWGGSYITTCEVDAWFPYGSYSTDTQTRYDFWAGSTWLGWPGHNINQNLAPAGWNVLAKSLPVNSSTAVVVSVHDAGGSGNLAMAAMRFICTFN